MLVNRLVFATSLACSLALPPPLSAQTAARVTFSSTTSTSVGTRDPAGRTVGDFNQDGHLDLIVTSKGSPFDNVRLLTGDGSGTLTQARAFTFGDAAAVTAADFNGDGAIDVAVSQDLATKGGGYVDVVCGSVVGVALIFGPDLASGWCLAAMPRILGLRAGDFDGDGRPDLAMVSALSQGLRIYKQLNFVNFTWTQTTVPGGALQATSMAPPADLNGDGRPDLVVAHAAGISTFLGNGDATFATGGSAGSTARQALAVADLNRDGVPDIASIESAAPGGLYVSFGAAGGSFSSRLIATLGQDLSDVGVADVDADGHDDIIVSHRANGAVRLFFGDGTGTFAEDPALALTMRPKLVAPHDWDEDGDLDLGIVDGAIAGQDTLASIALQDGTGAPDVAAPTVAIAIPADGSSISRTVAVRAVATDDVGVTRVEFLRDSAVIARSAGPEYTIRWDTSAWPDGTGTLTARAFDAAGNYADASVTITLANADTTPPVITVPDGLSAGAPSAGGVRVSFAATATDDRDGALSPRCVPASGAIFLPGATRVTCTATDAAGNAASRSFAVTVTVVAPPIAIAALTTSPASPQAYGTSITWNVVASGGIAPLEYQFWRYSYATSRWTLARDYGATASFSWTPGAADVGAHALQVWIRSAGSLAAYDAYRGTNIFAVTDGPPVTLASVTASPASPARHGTTVTWTATPSAGTAAGLLEYEFWRYSSSLHTWTMVQGYGPGASYSWTPGASDVGAHYLQVRVRRAGFGGPYESALGSAAFLVTDNVPVAVTSVTANRVPPLVHGTPITWTTVAVGGSAPLEYQYWRYSYASGMWTLARDYSADPSYTWTPGASDLGTYAYQVWVRSAGSRLPYEGYRGTTAFTITNESPP